MNTLVCVCLVCVGGCLCVSLIKLAFKECFFVCFLHVFPQVFAYLCVRVCFLFDSCAPLVS